jgi:hypothetical protein
MMSMAINNNNLYSSPNIIRMIKEDVMGRACSRTGGQF